MSGKKYPVHPCEAGCGVHTTNQRFCSYRCASGSQTKRKPEGTCPACGGAMRTRQRQCDECTEKGIDGRTVNPPAEAPSEPPAIKINAADEHLFSLRDRCGDLIEHLLRALAGSSLNYLSIQSRMRHRAVLQSFKTFNVPHFLGHTDVPAVSLQLEYLSYALSAWVRSAVEKENAFPLWSSYVLATAEFVLEHAEGNRIVLPDSSVSELAPLVDDFSLAPFHELASGSRKKVITAGLTRHIMQVQLPKGTFLRGRYGRADRHTPTIFVQLMRCHASTRHWSDPMHFEVVCDDKPALAEATPFTFEAMLLPRQLVEHYKAGYSIAGMKDVRELVTIDGDWITHIAQAREFQSVRWRP